MKNKIEAIEEYLKYFPNDYNAGNNLLLCKYANELDIELNNSYYPRIEYGYFVINNQIKAGKKYNLTNTTTNHKQNGEDTIIIWSESCGRLAFVDEKYWHGITDEWEEFKNILKSYNPIDYDEINNNYIYDLENGKKLIKDHKDIMDNFKEKISKKINEIIFEKKKEEFERLKKELEGIK